MPRLRRNEWNFASNAAELMTSSLRLPEFASSVLGRAEPELTEFRGARRLDLVIFGRENANDAPITGELKVPWDPKGRTPYNSKVVEDAHGKASRVGALYFITWNVRRIVVWKTDDPGVALYDRVVYDQEIIPSTIALNSASDLDNPEIPRALTEGVQNLLRFLDAILTGPPEPTYLPLDRLFIARLESALYYPIFETAREIRSRMQVAEFRRATERWMRDVQGWVVSETTESQNIDHAARFTCYVLVNRLCFYNALRRKYRQLQRLSVPNSVTTGVQLNRALTRSFNAAKRFTGNYETVFDGDYGDSLPFLADSAVREWANLIRSLDRYDFANISLDVIGAMYEQLIKPAERHRYGQHYTQPAVVDLINSFALRTGGDRVLDPGCGGGTFLVRAYARKKYLDATQEHSELLETLYGCDILNYACHLSIINLAIRDLIDDDNFPRIHLGDFLRFVPEQVFSSQPTRIQAGGLPTGTREIRLEAQSCDAIIGNPPYINAREMRSGDRTFYHRTAARRWPRYNWRRAADIYTYFWLHAEQYLRRGGHLVLLTQAAWLDVEYGIPLQLWMLQHFKIVAILETEAEPWFSDARVATVVTVLQEESDPHRRAENRVRFVQFRSRLITIMGAVTNEPARQIAVETLRDQLLSSSVDTETADYRIRLLDQSELESTGTRDGEYVGSKWGRYLRSTQTIYDLQKSAPESFIPLGHLAHVQRGATTNCDDFFIVSDVGNQALNSIPEPEEFRGRYGTNRRAVTSGEVTIVRRKDGVELPIERQYLRSIIKTARDLDSFVTRDIESSCVVVLPQHGLARLARAYVSAGERERWHLSPSFEAIRDAGGRWYSLRELEVAPILFVKTMQYSPFVLWNDAEVLANQRLYNVQPFPDVDPVSLCAVMNSTVFACERYAAVKALGREAAIDVEVFSANLYRTPNVRNLCQADIRALGDAMRELSRRRVGLMIEEPLMELTLSAARAYCARTAVNAQVWPSEFRDQTRQQIDRIVLRHLGVEDSQLGMVRSTSSTIF